MPMKVSKRLARTVMIVKISYFALPFSLLLCLPAVAQDRPPTIGEYELATSRERLLLDVTPVINARLAELKDFHINDTCAQVPSGQQICRPGPCVPISGKDYFNGGQPKIVKISAAYELARMMCSPTEICHEGTVEKCIPSMGKLSLGGAIVVQAQPRLAITPPSNKELPVDYLVLTESYKNCSPEKGNFTFSHTLEQSVGLLVRKQKAVKTGSSFTVSAKASFKYADMFGSEIAGSTNTSKEITITDLNEEDYREKKSFAFSLPVTIPSQTQLSVTHEWIKRLVPIKYVGTVVLDGQVASNRAGVTLISEALPEKEKRTFDFEGILEEALMFEGKTTVLTKPLSAEDCPAPSDQ